LIGPCGGAGVWQLSGTATRRFVNLPYARYVLPVPGRRAIVRITCFTILAWGGWRANGPGTAVCGLTGASSPRRRLTAVAVWVLAAVAALTGWVGWVAVWSAIGLIIIPVLTFLGFAGLMMLLGWRAARVGKAKSKLGKLNWTVAPPTHGLSACPAHQVEVHMVASEEPGAGRALLASVAVEADRNGWALLLDAANDRLAAYYRGLGFLPIGPPADMPFGERVTRMVRQPLAGLERGAQSEAPRSEVA
jgi:hypothetical protein